VSTSTAESAVPTDPAPAWQRRVWWRQLGVDTTHVLVGFPLSTVAFVLVARGFATVERIRIPDVLRREVPTPVYRRAGPEASVMRRLIEPLRDPQSWLDTGHALLHLLVSIPAFVVAVTWWSVAVSGLTYAAYDWTLPRGPENQDLLELLAGHAGVSAQLSPRACSRRSRGRRW
jgi:Putative sensor